MHTRIILATTPRSLSNSINSSICILFYFLVVCNVIVNTINVDYIVCSLNNSEHTHLRYPEQTNISHTHRVNSEQTVSQCGTRWVMREKESKYLSLNYCLCDTSLRTECLVFFASYPFPPVPWYSIEYQYIKVDCGTCCPPDSVVQKVISAEKENSCDAIKRGRQPLSPKPMCVFRNPLLPWSSPRRNIILN